MMKLLGFRSTSALVVVLLALVLTACDQGIASFPTAQSVATRAADTQVRGDQATATTSTTPTTAASAPAGAVGTEPTATMDARQDGSTDPLSAGLDLTTVDPCKLLTAEDVKSVMGEVPYQPRQMTQESYHTACTYVEPTLEVSSPRLFLSLDPVETWDFHVSDVQPVSGIGDEANTHEFDGWRTVWVLLKNKAVVSMDIYPPDTEKAKQMLSRAIERLP